MIRSDLGSGKILTPFYRKISPKLGSREPVGSSVGTDPLNLFSFVQQAYFKNNWYDLTVP